MGCTHARNSHTAHAQHTQNNTHRRHAHNTHTHTQTYVLHTYSAKRSQGVQLDEKDLGLDNYQTPSGGYIPSNPNRTKHTGSDGTRAQVSLSLSLSVCLSIPPSLPPSLPLRMHPGMHAGVVIRAGVVIHVYCMCK